MAIKHSYEPFDTSGAGSNGPPNQQEIPNLAQGSKPQEIVSLSLFDGRYELRDNVGTGGTGTVWRAYDHQVSRVVALKRSMKPEDDRLLLIDARKASTLQHPNIIPIFDLQPHGNNPYFTMPLIAGKRTLSDAISEYHKGKLSLNDVLRTFIVICDAVQYAHEQGVVHLDLKPSNVALSQKNIPTVVDWGLARINETAFPSEYLQSSKDEAAAIACFSQGRATIGTPAYCAPEQARGDVAAFDSHTDIYLLGAMLFEILYNGPPHSGPSRAKKDVSKVRFVPTTLVAICSTAMAEEKDDRYETAWDLASDIENYMRGRWVSRCPHEPWLEHMWRLRKAYPVTTRIVMTILFVAISIIAAALAYATIVAHQSETKAIETTRLSFEAVDNFYKTVIAEDLFQKPGTQPLQDKLLTEAIVYYEQFVIHSRGSPHFQHELVLARLRLGEIKITLREPSKAVSVLEQALGELTILRSQNGGEEETLLFEEAKAIDNLATAYHLLGNVAESEKLRNRAQNIFGRLIELHPTSNARNGLSKSLHNLVILYREQQRFKEAVETSRKVAEEDEKIVNEYPEELKYRAEWATGLLTYANTLRDGQDFSEAAATCKKAIAIWEHITKADTTNPEYLSTQALTENTWGTVLELDGKLFEAGAHYHLASTIQEKVVNANPSVAAYRDEWAMSLENLATWTMREQRWDVARKLLEKLESERTWLRDHNPDVIDFRIKRAYVDAQWGRFFREQRQYGDAIVSYNRSVETLVGIKSGNAIVYLTRTLVDRGICLFRLKSYQAACDDFTRAWELDANESATVTGYRAYTLVMLGNYREAAKALKGAKDAKTADDLFNRGAIFARCISAVEMDKALGDSESKVLISEYLLLAIREFEAARRAGLSMEFFARDADLAALKKYREFEKFLRGAGSESR